jgi:hypothetical protein
VKETTVKMLFALSGNRCAFPRCKNRLIERGVVVGEMCHIEAKEAGGPRYNEHQTKEEREAFENFILMCAIHHKVIDTKPADYPVPMLQDWKAKHEDRVTAGATVRRHPLTADQVHQFMQTTNIVHAVTSINQQGGQTAYHITNVYHESAKAPQPSLVPVVEILMTGGDNQMKIDRYDFRVRLRNEGEVTAREFCLEVEVPIAYANPTNSSMALAPQQNREGVKFYRHTQEKFPGFVLYPGETSDHVLLIDFQLLHDQYADVNETITVLVYSGDAKPTITQFPIRDYRNKHRIDQLGLQE